MEKLIGCPIHNRGLIALGAAAVGYAIARGVSSAGAAAANGSPGGAGQTSYHTESAVIVDKATMPEFPVYRIALTGGPCSGKSTCVRRIREELTEIGFRVFVVPEAATLLMGGGCVLATTSPTQRVAQQRLVLQLIMMLEDSFYQMARLGNAPAVILCDRGTLDGRAYCTEEQWEAVMSASGYSIEELRDTRYDAVIHLVTAAIGAEESYTTANNATRRETAAEAAALDLKTRQAWNGHRMLTVIDNDSTFEHKMDRVVDFIKRIARVQTVTPTVDPHTRLPKKTHLKQFAVKAVTGELPDAAEVADVTVRVLKPLPQYREEKVIRRKAGMSTFYYHRAEGLEPIVSNGHRLPSVTFVQIDHVQYAKLLTARLDESAPLISKTHTAFFHKNRYFTLTKWWSPESMRDKVVLSAPHDVASEDLPPYIQVE